VLQLLHLDARAARKGLADTALKDGRTRGYLTRRLVDVAQDVHRVRDRLRHRRRYRRRTHYSNRAKSSNRCADRICRPAWRSKISAITRTNVIVAVNQGKSPKDLAAAIQASGIERRQNPLGAHLRIQAREFASCATGRNLATGPLWSKNGESGRCDRGAVDLANLAPSLDNAYLPTSVGTASRISEQSKQERKIRRPFGALHRYPERARNEKNEIIAHEPETVILGRGRRTRGAKKNATRFVTGGPHHCSRWRRNQGQYGSAWNGIRTRFLDPDGKSPATVHFKDLQEGHHNGPSRWTKVTRHVAGLVVTDSPDEKAAAE